MRQHGYGPGNPPPDQPTNLHSNTGGENRFLDENWDENPSWTSPDARFTWKLFCESELNGDLADVDAESEPAFPLINVLNDDDAEYTDSEAVSDIRFSSSSSEGIIENDRHPIEDLERY